MDETMHDASPVRLQRGDFSVDAELSLLRANRLNAGGLACFVGCARDFSNEHRVQHLDFDAYDSMALKVLHALRHEAIAQFRLIDARIVHRTGFIAAGEQIVLIATAAEHRAPALHACEWLIDELKQRTPIWKRETTPEGQSWVTPRP